MSIQGTPDKPTDPIEEFKKSIIEKFGSLTSMGFIPPNPYMGNQPPPFMPPPVMSGFQGMFNQAGNLGGFPPGYGQNNSEFHRNNLEIQLRSLEIQKNQIRMTIIQMENQLKVIKQISDNIRAEIEKLD